VIEDGGGEARSLPKSGKEDGVCDSDHAWKGSNQDGLRRRIDNP
jgi:hypothetical protein